jgi:MFS family permease
LKQNSSDDKGVSKALFISVFTAMMGFGIISPLLPVYSKSLGATGLWLGVIFAGFSFSRTIFMPIFGKMSDTRGKKRFINIGLLLYSIISISYIFAYDVYSLTVIRIIHGLASAMVIPIARATVGESSLKGEEGRKMGNINTSIFLGIAFGPITMLSIFAFLISIFFLPNNMNMKRKRKSVPYLTALKSERIQGLFILRIIRAINLGVLYVFLPLYAVIIELSSIEIGILLSLTVFLNALLQRPLGNVSDKLDRRSLIILGLLCSSIPLFFIPFSKNFLEILFIICFIGIGRGIVMSASTAMSVEEGRKLGMGYIMGFLNSGMGIGLISASLISGVLFDTFGIMIPFYFAGLLSLIGAPIIFIKIKQV